MDQTELLSKPEKVVLALLATDGKPIKGETWYHNELFLSSEFDHGLKDELDFMPHHYGPYSCDAKDVLDNLTSEGFVRKTGEEIVLTGRGEEAF